MKQPTKHSSRRLHVPLFWLSILPLPIVRAQMPYNPTRILHNGTTLYVFQPSSGSSSQFELGSIDISSKVASSNVPYTTLYSTLPFLDSIANQPFTPVLDNGGNMTVYTGDCSKGASGAEIWNFTPEPAGKSGNGSWEQQDIKFNPNDKHVDTIGANYLSAGMAFSAVVDDDTSGTGAYFFGGMCPSQGQVNDWQLDANYSNLMIRLEQGKENSRSLTYQLDVSSNYGPPIPEAGFTLTGLSPSFSNRSDGTQTQQQNFVLVGGHTRSAFINMSQVALFSLPQQGWTFVPVDQPDTGRTDLAIRTDIHEVEPRSGHTAVLTPDGQRIIIFGGWVGDIDTPAIPQMAVLNVGVGYGGQELWEWTVPTTSGDGLPGNSGIYGHGAAMLPGGVMMITGGYSIVPPASRWRRASTSANTKTLFFNTTSNSFISEYSPPEKSTPSAPADSGGPLASTGQKAGLGVGLGIGMAAVLTLLIFYILFTRRAKKQRQVREAQLQSLSMDAHRYNLECISPGVDGRGGRDVYFDEPNDSYFYPTPGRHLKSGWRQANGHDAERTGLLVEIPSPTRGLRRSLSGRGQHHMSRYDERRAKGAGDIHPIDEEEEHEEDELDITDDRAPLNGQSEMTERPAKQGGSIFDTAPVLEPFVDIDRAHQRSPVHSAPASPVREENQNGSGPSDWQLALGALLPRRASPNSKGRSSPDHSERTSSNLSEQSHRSNLSSNSTNGSIQRTASMRSTAMMKNANQANPFKTPNGSPTSKKPNRESVAGWESPDARTQSLSSIRSALPSTAEERDSFTTARTSFMQLQAEGEALLGGAPNQVRPGTASTSTGSNPRTYQETEPSMSRAGTITAATSVTEGPTSRPRRKSWLGSVRRVLGRATDTSDGRTRSLNTSTPQLERYTDNPMSPTRPDQEDNRKSLSAAAPPRRAASDASFWRSKRGRQDWLDEELDENDPRARWRRTSGDDWGAPEDLALAERERQRREWRQRGTLINLGDDELPTPRTPIHQGDLGDPNRPHTPADEEDWDVEAAVERRVVQVMFTVPKSKLRVVNADVDRSSVLSLPRENSDDSTTRGSPDANGTPNRVKDLVGRFEQHGSRRHSPRISPSPSIKSLKVRGQGSSPSLAAKRSSPNLPTPKARLASEDITTGDRS